MAKNTRVMLGLNLPMREWNRPTLAKFIGSFDHLTSHMAGIFDQSNDTMVGFVTLDVNLMQKTAHITAAIGDEAYVGKRVLYEAAPVFIRHLFDEHNLDKISARILASNRQALFNFMMPDVFVFEAKLKQEVIGHTGKREDILVFSAFRSPWFRIHPATIRTPLQH
ncbi:GNAT family N-acetyltransferase [Paraburkholderia aspalathi]|nr:GNAT family N-acetyltransferase [Paraburkholderia aspalathi]